MITEIQRLQQLAGLLNESGLGAAYAERELDGDASRQMHENEDEADYSPESEYKRQMRTALRVAKDSGIIKYIDQMMVGGWKENRELYNNDYDAYVRHVASDAVEELPYKLLAPGVDYHPLFVKLINKRHPNPDKAALNEDNFEDEESSPLEDFAVGDYVFIKSQRQAGHIMAFDYKDNLIAVRLYSGKAVKVDPAELEKMDEDEEEEDHEGTWADFKGDERSFNEEEGKVIPFTPKKEKGVRVQDFEDDNDGNLDDYISKLVAQQMNKGKQIQFNPKK